MFKIFPISAIDRVNASNLHLTFARSAEIIADHLHERGFIHAEPRSFPLLDVAHSLSVNQIWDQSAITNRDMLLNDPESFLINAARNYVEVPEYPYEKSFFSVPFSEMVVMLNIVLSRFHLIADAPEPYMRITRVSRYTDTQRHILNNRQQRYFYLQAQKISANDSDNVDYTDVGDYEECDDWVVPVVERGFQCGSYTTTSDVPLIEHQVVIVCDDLYDRHATKVITQEAPSLVCDFTLKLTECLVSPLRNYEDVKMLQSLKDEVFVLPPDQVVPYVDYLLSTPECSRNIMSCTPDWSLTRQYRFFFSPKGSGKSTQTKQLHARSIGVFEDEHLMKLIPYKEAITKYNLEVWRSAIRDRFIFVMLMAIARGDHVIWSVSNFIWFANHYPWLRAISGVILDTATVFQHSNQSETELHAKRQRDALLIDELVESGYPVRYSRTLGCALNPDDTRLHDVWMEGSCHDSSYIERRGNE